MEFDKETIQQFKNMQERLSGFEYIQQEADEKHAPIYRVILHEAFNKMLDESYPLLASEQEIALAKAAFYLRSIDVDKVVERAEHPFLNIHFLINNSSDNLYETLDFLTSESKVSVASYADEVDEWKAGLVDKPSQAKQNCLLFIKNTLRPVDKPNAIAITDDCQVKIINLNSNDEDNELFVKQVENVAKGYRDYIETKTTDAKIAYQNRQHQKKYFIL